MSRLIIMAASLSLIGAGAAMAAPAAKAPFPMAKDGTTNIADCAKVDVRFRNECISKSRPVPGAQVYAAAAAQQALAAKAERLAALKAAKVAKADAAAKAAAAKAALVKAAKAATILPKVAGVPKGFKIAKDGTTSIYSCDKAAASVRNECISRARPLTGAELAKYVKAREKAVPAVAAVSKPEAKVAPVVAAKVAPAVQAPAKPALAIGKGFKIAKDGTTDIADCAKANPDFRNECISRARPVPGKLIYAATKSKL